MTAKAVDVAVRLRDALAAQFPTIPVAIDYTPRLDVGAGATTERIILVPSAQADAIESRDQATAEVDVDIAYMLKVAQSQDDIEAGLDIVDQISALVFSVSIAGWIATAIERDPIFEPTHLEQIGQLTSVLRVTMRESG